MVERDFDQETPSCNLVLVIGPRLENKVQEKKPRMNTDEHGWKKSRERGERRQLGERRQVLSPKATHPAVRFFLAHTEAQSDGERDLQITR